ncbi:MAG TPA: SDR family oxidoreductase, partial [Rhodospirillales bacterium]|nr:SDR family oxidoreductase [Rhodospirillales bacterium]
MRLASQIALITGGSGGFGQAICQRFIEEGSTVILADIDEEKLAELALQYRDKSNQVKCMTLDVSDFEKVELGVNSIISEYGKIDILVNNAGYLPKNDHWLENPIEDWHKVIDVNLSGEFYCARAVANQMMERRGGRIINISSSAFRHGGVPGGGGISYTASKAGVVGLTRSLAKALGPYNITVN